MCKGYHREGGKSKRGKWNNFRLVCAGRLFQLATPPVSPCALAPSPETEILFRQLIRSGTIGETEIYFVADSKRANRREENIIMADSKRKIRENITFCGSRFGS